MTTPRFEVERRFERFQLEPMYSSITVQKIEGRTIRSLEGHAYDVSESGARIELDEVLAPLERVTMCLELPGETRPMVVNARVVWVHDGSDDPGPRRMAVEFTRFLEESDRLRLKRYVGRGIRRAA